jgi:SagB-type dehydrogenase family enzyme
MPSRRLYRRARHLVCHWQDEDLVVRNYRTGRAVAIDPLSALLLHRLDSWLPLQAVAPDFPGIPRAALARLVRSLAKHSLLESSTNGARKLEDPLKNWETWSPLAAFFHFGTRNIPIRIDDESSERALVEKAKSRPPPRCIKRYRSTKVLRLPPVRASEELPRVLLKRRTWRRFGKGHIPLDHLAQLLGLTFRVQRWVSTKNFDRIPLKTSPSAGACHPIEAYVLALEVEGLPRGLYHYAADRHALELLKRGARGKDVTRYIPGQPEYRAAAALVFMTAVFPRAQWRYDYPRAYRSVLLEAGHFCQTFCLVATWLDLAPFETALLDDARLEKDLGVDGIDEAVLYAAGVGIRKKGVEWAP